jgi:hypothetical protein
MLNTVLVEFNMAYEISGSHGDAFECDGHLGYGAM